jgi:hypothetical protein
MLHVLPVDQLASELGFAHLTWAGEVNQFLGLIGLQSIIKAAFHARFFSTFLKHFAIESRLLFKVLNNSRKSGAAEIMSHQGQDGH